MTRLGRPLFVVALACALCSKPAPPPPPSAPRRVAAARLPLGFEATSEGEFVARMSGTAARFSRGRVTFGGFSIKFPEQNAAPQALQPLEGTVNELLGDDPRRWRLDV